MNPVYKYLRDVYLGVTTILIGMGVTLRHWLSRSVTVQYPHEKLTYPPRARTMLVNDIDGCTGCRQCARACPVEIIHIETVKGQPEDDLGFHPDGKPRKLHVLVFDVEMSKCIFCGLCVEVCPTESLHWENLHEEVTYSREDTVRHWAKYPPEEVKRLLERDAKIRAEKAAKAAAAAAAEKPLAGEKPAPKPAPQKPESTEKAAAAPKPPDAAEKSGAEAKSSPAARSSEKNDHPAEPTDDEGGKEDAS